ncbi:acyl-CoA thioesterase [Xanthobacter agilis]|uniref:Acyl-CoA thioester hydrolase n=1 Tax=Xanthobacter agilis TaxID=47492 RepID=A0ABU0LEG4_XANAG|nr:thioesterase family protein [Xanthobacter agilis]MDQ0505521.1 acyl-CoA thioester hydrolase [Xanthobacter agilis]
MTGTEATAKQAGREAPFLLADFPHVLTLSTRWADVDVYGHVNNVVYYSYFDTVVNEHLIAHGVLDPQASPVIGLVVETRCTYFRSLTFPAPVTAAMRVAKLGASSVRYEIALFQGEDPRAAAQGHFVHVYVDRATQRPAAVPDAVRRVLQPLA